MRLLFKFVRRRQILLDPQTSSYNTGLLDVYYLAFPKESFRMKILVYAVFAAEATQTILYSKMAFEEFVAGFGNLEALNAIGNFWFTIPILSSSGMFSWPLLFVRLQVN